MKKAFMGLAILGVYAIYALGVRHQHPLIPKPSSLSGGGGSTSGAAAQTQQSQTSGSSPTSSSASSSSNNGRYRDGTYTGSTADAYYGNVQVSVTISGGRISDVRFLQYPNSHSASVYINQQAMPYLKQEALQSQNANVQIISGATFTSQAFAQSLQSALNKA